MTPTDRFRFPISTPPTRRRSATCTYHEDEQAARIAADLEAVFDVPVQVSAVLGRSKMDVGELLKLGPGTVLELDRRVGEAIDIYVNNRLVARGEVVLVEDKLGVTMTEIIKAERSLTALFDDTAPDRREQTDRRLPCGFSSLAH